MPGLRIACLGITIGWLLPDKNAGSVQPVPSQTNYNESDREEEISEEALEGNFTRETAGRGNAAAHIAVYIVRRAG